MLPVLPLDLSVVEAVLLALSLAVAFSAGAVWESSGWAPRAQAVAARLLGARRGGARCRLVGAGPGDVALLTVAAKTAIAEADVVIADLLVPEETLALVRGRLVLSRKYKGCANKAQDELHRWTLEALRQGLDVVRLKGGDPFVYGRGAEEIRIFRKAGFAVEVVPGLSSALAAPLAAGIALTTRGVADQVLIATGHGMNDSVPRDVPEYYAGRTTVFLMSVSRMPRLMERLLSLRYPPGTSVSVVEKATTADMRVVRGTVATIADVCAREGVQSPATIVVGRATRTLLDGDGDGDGDEGASAVDGTHGRAAQAHAHASSYIAGSGSASFDAAAFPHAPPSRARSLFSV